MKLFRYRLSMCEGDGMEEWKECKLSEIMDLIGGGTPKTSNPDYWGGDIPWISVKDFNGERRYVGDTEKKITKLGLENSSTKILSKGDIIISARGTVGELAIIPSDMAFNQSCYGLRAKDFVDSCFLYYLLKQSVNILKHNTDGSVFDTITRETFENISVKLPPLPTQQKIAAILSSLDDKIELNNKINTNLEQQAGPLFKNWFVDFEPFGGKMPDGWKVGKLSDVAEITSGKRPPMKQSNYSKDVSIPLVGAASVMGYTNQVLYNEPILITGRVGTHGVIQRFSTECWPSDNTLVIKSKYYEYVYQIMSNIDYDNMNRGSTQPLITQSDLGKVECIIPDEKNLNKFEQLMAILFSKVHKNQQENHKLANIRDTLLPKLMNGEIEV